MISAHTLQTTHRRLATHYLTQLRTADAALVKGIPNKQYGNGLLAKEWVHITRWQQHAASHQQQSKDWAFICREYGRSAASVVFFTCTPPQRLAWWIAALGGARQAGDPVSERIFLNKLSAEYSTLGQLEKVRECSLELLDLAQRGNDQKAVGDAVYQLATLAEDQGRFDEASEQFEQARRIFERFKHHMKTARALHGLGRVADYQGRYVEAHQYFLRCMQITAQPGWEVDHCYAVQGVAETLNHLGKIEEAEVYYRQAVNLSRKIDFRFAVGPALVGLASCLLEQGRLEDALPHFVEGITLTREHSAFRDLLHGLISLGYLYWQQGELPAALAHLQEALEQVHTSEFPVYEARAHRCLSLIYLDQNALDQSKQHLRMALALSQTLSTQPEIESVIRCAAYLALRTGQAETAALWSGAITAQPNQDRPFHDRLHQGLVQSHGQRRLKKLLSQGRSLTLEAVLVQVTAFLAPA